MTESSLESARERATAAWKARWDSEIPVAAPALHRYSVTFTCREDTFEEVLSHLKGFPLASRTWRMHPDSQTKEG
jgi:hypothetical protein